MTCLSCLGDETAPLILDTSVLINLYASSYGKRILAEIPNDIYVPESVVRELDHETSRSNGDNEFVSGLVSQGIVNIAQLGEKGYQIYEQLICGHGSLDDGEAATIAAAVAFGYIPVIDERKGRSRALALVDCGVVAWSLDLFLHPAVKLSLTKRQFIEAIYLALYHGRMRIDEKRCDAVAKLIGIERALTCTSLPRFKVRRELWVADVS